MVLTGTGTLVSEDPRGSGGGWRIEDVHRCRPSAPQHLVHAGTKFPTWKDSLFVGALNGKSLQRVSFNQPSQAERRELLLTQLDIRIEPRERDVVQGPCDTSATGRPGEGVLTAVSMSPSEKVSAGNNPDGTVLRRRS